MTPTGPETWAIGGGKGGVGKSWVTLALAYWAGRFKREIVLMDADLGGANLHTMLGMRIPEKTLDDFVLRRAETLDEIVLPTAWPRVGLLAGGSDTPALANPNFGQKARILRSMQKLNSDLLFVDLGAGTSLNTLDFFLACPNKLVIMTPQPTSIQNAYGFVKSALFRRVARVLRPSPLKGWLDSNGNAESFPQSMDEILEEVSLRAPEWQDDVRAVIDEIEINLIVNMVRDAKEEKIGKMIQEVCRRFLGLTVNCLGSVPYDPRVEKWSATMDPGSIGKEGGGDALRAAYEIAYGMLGASVSRQDRAA